MGSRWYALIVDAVDPERLARWWAEVLDHRVERVTPEEVVIGPAIDGHPRIVFLQHDDGKPANHRAPNRLHIDLRPDDLDAELERLVNMGARHVDVGQSEGAPWVVLADPEGNEFCIIRPKR
jgi:predicted enzyme related to lactoylglutathione lyase